MTITFFLLTIIFHVIIHKSVFSISLFIQVITCCSDHYIYKKKNCCLVIQKNGIYYCLLAVHLLIIVIEYVSFASFDQTFTQLRVFLCFSGAFTASISLYSVLKFSHLSHNAFHTVGLRKNLKNIFCLMLPKLLNVIVLQ